MAYAGPLPQAPLNTFGMLTDYIAPEQRSVACPNQDVVYGAGYVGARHFAGSRPGAGFWRHVSGSTKSSICVPKPSYRSARCMARSQVFMYWPDRTGSGEVPKGITKLFRCTTNTAFVGPRVFQDDTPEDKRAIQAVLQQVMMYPLAEYDGKMKTDRVDRRCRDSRRRRPAKGDTVGLSGEVRRRAAVVLADAPPLPGEEARYAQVLAVLEAVKSDPKLKPPMTEAAQDAGRHSWSRCSSFATTATNCPTTGARSPMRPRSAPTISPAPRWRSRTSSSTRRTRRSTSTRISTRTAPA